MTVTTTKFAALLKEARSWDSRHQAMANAQTEWLLEHFVIADTVCRYATPIDRRKWATPKVIQGRLYTRCG